MKATKQYISVVLLRFTSGLAFESVNEILGATIQMKAVEL